MIPADQRRRWAEVGIPWWWRALAQVGFFAVMAPCFVWTVGVVAVVLAGAALSRLLPPSWRPVWSAPPPSEPPADDACPQCRSPLAAGPVAGEVQRSACPTCGCRAVRTCRLWTYGWHWSPWQAEDAEPGAAADTGGRTGISG